VTDELAPHSEAQSPNAASDHARGIAVRPTLALASEASNTPRIPAILRSPIVPSVRERVVGREHPLAAHADDCSLLQAHLCNRMYRLSPWTTGRCRAGRRNNACFVQLSRHNQVISADASRASRPTASAQGVQSAPSLPKQR